MTAPLLAALIVIVSWWFSTGAILLIDGLPPSTFRYSVGAASGLSLAGCIGLHLSSSHATPAAAYVAFACALLVWAWHELTFLLGLVTGPRKQACPADAHGWRRFRLATVAVIHHELALAATMLLVVALTWEAPNQVGTWTLLVLWIMRLSAKLNVFLGVRNLSIDFIPPHLRYLTTYFRRATLNPLMPVSLLGTTVACVWLWRASRMTPESPFAQVSLTLVATLLSLGLLEHVFLAVPLPDAWLWRWAVRNRERSAADGGVSAK